MTELQQLRNTYRLHKTELLTSLKTGGATTRGLRSTLHKLASLADGLLTALWQHAGFDAHCALLAVGGFGRGELFPHSDVDVLVLLPNGISPDTDPELKTRIENFIGTCWDAGLEIGSSVRTLAECVAEAAKDVTVQTSLLEARLIVGHPRLFAEFRERFDTLLDPHAFFVAKTLEMRQRHNKFENTPYSLEPNCKESPGGLRDLQVILWVTKAAGLGKSWDELARKGLLTPLEASQIKHNEALLSLIRTRLHLLANRREDRLVFDLQTVVAESFGYSNQTTADGRPALRASEVLMRRYYWAAKAVTQLNQIVMLNIEEQLQKLKGGHTHALRPINERFFEKAGMIEVASDDLYDKHPHAILETFLIYQTHLGLRGLSARTLRALYNTRNMMDSAFRHDPVNRSTFLRILQQPAGITHAMRLMNQTSVLGRYLWVFRRIVGQMQHDLFHVYTVDQHTMMVIRNLRRFTMEEFAHEYPFCTRLISEFDRHWLLYIAALFHDIAKGRGGDHSEQGTGDARSFCESHGLNGDDTELVVWLVRRHLTMSNVAQKQDVSDPDVVKAFAELIGDERHLTALYLLTVADIRGTSPKVWNSWKGQLLQDLYSATRRQLLQGAEAPAPHGVIQERQAEAMRLLRYFALSATVHERLWKQLDTVYFLRHSAEEIAWHTRCLHYRPNDEKPVVKVRINPNAEGLQVMVYTRDQQDLFARLVGFFGRAGYNIVDAKIHTTRHGYALDSFVLLDVSERDSDREMIAFIEHELTERLTKETPPETPATSRMSRRLKHFPITPTATIEGDDKGANFVLSIVAADRPGLLYAVATTLARHGATLQTAKIATLGERVEDTFLISGGGLNQSAGRISLESELLEQLKV